MELKRIKQIRDLEAEAISLRNPTDLAETESQRTPQERWEALNDRINPYLMGQYTPTRSGSKRKTSNVRETSKISILPAEGNRPEEFLQISFHPVGPYLRATLSYGEFPEGFGHLPGVKRELDPIVESFSPALICDGFDERLALGLLTAVEQSVEEFCNAMQPEEL